MKTPTPKTCQFVSFSSIAPKDKKFRELLYEDLGEGDFSWGDNNLSLVSAERILDHIGPLLDEHPVKLKQLFDALYRLDEAGVYIDLEH